MIILSNEEYEEFISKENIPVAVFSIFDTGDPLERGAFRMSPGYLSLMEFEWALFINGYTAECATLLTDGTPIIIAHKR
jgi:hypothetical protein